MYYADIKPIDVANGEGIRVSLFVSGCRHRCPGCFNREAWDFTYGQPYTDTVEERLVHLVGRPEIQGISLLGGEPLEQENRSVLLGLCQRIKQLYPGKDIWLYSGYEWEDLCAIYDETLQRLLEKVDILVDGRFDELQKDIRLRFRGSQNQRIIDVKKSLASGTIVLWEGMEKVLKSL